MLKEVEENGLKASCPSGHLVNIPRGNLKYTRVRWNLTR